MSLDEAQSTLMNMDPNAPWWDRAEFVYIMAAFSRVHCDVLSRSTGKTTLHGSIKAACDPDRIEWMLNQGRFRATLTSKENDLMPAGTTGNERVHKEINACFRPVTLITKHRLKLSMDFFHIRSMRRHLSAIQLPTSRLQTATQRSRYVAALEFFTDELWRQHARTSATRRRTAERNPHHRRLRPAREQTKAAVYHALHQKMIKTKKTIFDQSTASQRTGAASSPKTIRKSQKHL